MTTAATAPEALTATAPPTSRRARAWRATLAMGAGSAATFLVALVTLPLTIGYLGASRYGLLAAMLAAAALLEPLDLGVGSALVTLIADADARGARIRSVALARRAMSWMLAVAAVLVAVGALSLLVVPWGSAFGASDLPDSVTACVGVLIVGTALGLPLGLVDRINLGSQHGSRVGVTTVAGGVLSIAAIAVAASARAGVPVLLAASLAGPIVARTAAGLVLVTRWRPELRTGAVADRSARRALLGGARLFLVLQLAVAMAYTSDQLVIARVVGYDAVPQYSIAARLFGVVTVGSALLVRPLWPAYADAAAIGDSAWIHQTLQRSIRTIVVGSSVMSAALVAIAPVLIRRLSDDAVVPQTSVMVAFAVWSVVMSTGNAVAMALNGLGVVRMQVVVATAMALVNLALSITLARSMGVAGVLWGSVVAYTTCVGIPYARFVRSLVPSEPT